MLGWTLWTKCIWGQLTSSHRSLCSLSAFAEFRVKVHRHRNTTQPHCQQVWACQMVKTLPSSQISDREERFLLASRSFHHKIDYGLVLSSCSLWILWSAASSQLTKCLFHTWIYSTTLNFPTLVNLIVSFEMVFEYDTYILSSGKIRKLTVLFLGLLGLMLCSH